MSEDFLSEMGVAPTEYDVDELAENEETEATEVSIEPVNDDVVKIEEIAEPFYIKKKNNKILSIDANEEIYDTRKQREMEILHDFKDAAKNQRIICGSIEGVEKTKNGFLVATTSYMGKRVIIPLEKGMGYRLEAGDKKEYFKRLMQITNTLLDCEIDFVIKGFQASENCYVASRDEALNKKIRTYYCTPDETGKPKIYAGKKVQARVMAVKEKKMRIEVFGVEFSMHPKVIRKRFIGDLRDEYFVGDRINVIITEVNYPKEEADVNNPDYLRNITIKAECASLNDLDMEENFDKISEDGKYVGEVTDIHNNTIFMYLSVGVNAIAHKVLTNQQVFKGDRVRFVCKQKTPETLVAKGYVIEPIRKARR